MRHWLDSSVIPLSQSRSFENAVLAATVVVALISLQKCKYGHFKYSKYKNVDDLSLQFNLIYHHGYPTKMI